MIRQIEVTQHFIDTGSRQSCSFCPVALAIIDNLKLKHLKILVSPSYIGFYPKNCNDPNKRLGKVLLPTEVYSWIMAFDTPTILISCKPFKFSIVIQDSLWRYLQKINTHTGNYSG